MRSTVPRLRDEIRMTLLERVLADLEAEHGRRPSKRRLEACIRAGAASVGGRVVHDPGHEVAPDERVVFNSEDAELPRVAGPARRAYSAPTLPTGVLHADAQLVVVLREAPIHGERRLAPDAPLLHPVHDPSAPGSGPVLLATSAAVAQRLDAAIRAGRVLETLYALRAPSRPGPGEALEQSGPLAVLIRREESPLAPPPPGAPDLFPPARVLLALKHPRTNRRLVFEADPPPAFGAALAAALAP